MPQILFLTLKTFSLTGGVEKVCRIMAHVLYELQQKGIFSASVFSMHDKHSDVDTAYCPKQMFTGFAGNKIKAIISTVLTARTCDILILSHINLLLAARILNLFYPKKQVVLIAHGIEIWGNISTGKKRFLNKPNVEIWAVSNYTADRIVQKHRVNGSRIKVLNNCLDPFLKIGSDFNKPEYLLKRHGLQPGQPVLFTLTRLASTEKYKGYDLVIDALAELRAKYGSAVYILGGKADAVEAARLQKLIAEKNLQEQVKLIGFVKDEELSDYFKLADVFVMPSRKEGFGIVFIEAAASGCKVIGGNIDGSVDALLNGTLGLPVNPLDPEEIKQAIETQLNLERSPEIAARIQKASLDSFSYSQYKERVEILLKNHLN